MVIEREYPELMPDNTPIEPSEEVKQLVADYNYVFNTLDQALTGEYRIYTAQNLVLEAAKAQTVEKMVFTPDEEL